MKIVVMIIIILYFVAKIGERCSTVCIMYFVSV